MSQKSGAAEVLKQYRSIREAFPTCDAVGEVAIAFAHNSVNSILKDKQYRKAAAYIEVLMPLLDTEKEKLELRERFYFAWIFDLTEAKNWEAAIAKALEAIKTLPESDDMKSQGVDIIIRWSQPSMDAKKWDDAIAIYERGLKEFPGDGRLTNNLEFCKQNKAKKLK